MGKKCKKQTIKVDEEFLSQLEDAVANGVQTIVKMAESVAVSKTTFERMLYGKRENGEKEKELIKEAIKKGKRRYFPAIRRLAENELVKRVQGYYVNEQEKTTQSNNGSESTTVKNKTKWVQASTTELIFALVNSSQGKWVSINNMKVEFPDDKDFSITYQNKND